MTSGQIIFLEMSLVLGLVIAWGAWELYTLRRERRRREQQEMKPDRD